MLFYCTQFRNIVPYVYIEAEYPNTIGSPCNKEFVFISFIHWAQLSRLLPENRVPISEKYFFLNKNTTMNVQKVNNYINIQSPQTLRAY
jgi:hypothetical protein